MRILSHYLPACWGALFLSTVAQAFPVLIPGTELPGFIGHKQDTLVAFAVSSDKSWKRVPFQVDELEEGGFLVVRNPTRALPERKDFEHARDKDPFEGAISEVHRVIFDDADFEKCDEKCASGAIAAAQNFCGLQQKQPQPYMVRIDLSYRKTTLFFASCNGRIPAGNKPSNAGPAVDFSMRTLKGEEFNLTYSPKSPVLVEKLTVGGGDLDVFSGSLAVSLKPGSLLSLKYTEDDLPSVITSYDSKALATALELASSKRILGVRVSSQVCCDMSVYKDAFYFPVIIEPPFNVSSLRKGSEIRYGFRHKEKGALKIQTDMPLEGSSEKKIPRGTGYVVLDEENAVLGLGIRSRSENKAGIYVTGLRVDGKPVSDQLGFLIDLAAQEFKKPIHYEVWFYMGNRNQKDIVKEYSQNGIRYQILNVLH